MATAPQIAPQPLWPLIEPGPHWVSIQTLVVILRKFWSDLAEIVARELMPIVGGKFAGNVSWTSGTLTIPVVTSDPVSPANGTFWYNATTNQFRGVVGGAVKTFTVS